MAELDYEYLDRLLKEGKRGRQRRPCRIVRSHLQEAVPLCLPIY